MRIMVISELKMDARDPRLGRMKSLYVRSGSEGPAKSDAYRAPRDQDCSYLPYRTLEAAPCLQPQRVRMSSKHGRCGRTGNAARMPGSGRLGHRPIALIRHTGAVANDDEVGDAGRLDGHALCRKPKEGLAW
jgi:hypothetical protein